MADTMRIGIALMLGMLLVASTAAGADPSPLDSGPIAERFRDEVRPFLNTYCLKCHSAEKPKGDMDLSAFDSPAKVAADLARWELVLEQLEGKTMPPAEAKLHPPDSARSGVIAWVRAVRKAEADRNAGDPGSVPARRLSNAEYDYTIRDLTGQDIRPTREFPVDPANEAGFDNSAESLTVSPSLVKKYLEAARKVADHVVLRPDGLDFAAHPVVADTDRDKYSVRRIIDFYKSQKLDLGDFVFAAWQFRNREALGKPSATLDDLAADRGISPKYLKTVWAILNDPTADSGPIAALQAMWIDLPGPTEPGLAFLGCERIGGFLKELRLKLSPEVKNLRVRGMGDGSQPLVLWKNGQFAATRRRYVGTAAQVKPDDLSAGTSGDRRMALPADPESLKRAEPDFHRFCSVFPDAFLVSERARVFLDPKADKDNTGRLLSAGFHSMTGYYRDDAPLSELILDEAGRAELDRLWIDFDVVTGAPARQYSSFLWFERAETRFLSGTEFDFARAEDKSANSEPMMARFAAVYLAKAEKNGGSEEALKAIRDFFATISGQLRRVERTKLEAEPRHLEALRKLAERAYRRPLSKAESDGVERFYRILRDEDGLSHEDAVRDSVVGILMSPHYLYRVDLPSQGTGVRPRSDHDLASRLSYFLWSSLPDDELLALAAKGELHRPDVLARQARRMLRDDRARALAVEFGGNWLDFRRFEEHNSVDRGRFPAFNDTLRQSMFEEPIRFVVDLMRRDGSLDEFLDGTHTFVNAPLARHYGMPMPPAGADGWGRIDDARPFGRGGLLPMAVFLTKNSPGLRTSPVKRGYWVVKRLLGENIPPPPANVPELPADESKLGDLTLREALARHRADQSCAGCHERFDAVGLAFEGFGPVGESRKLDLGGHPVDVRATFPGGMEGLGGGRASRLPPRPPPRGLRRQPLPKIARLRPRPDPDPLR